MLLAEPWSALLSSLFPLAHQPVAGRLTITEEELLDEQLVDLSGPAMDVPGGQAGLDAVPTPAAAAAAPAPAPASAEQDEFAALEAQMA